MKFSGATTGRCESSGGTDAAAFNGVSIWIGSGPEPSKKMICVYMIFKSDIVHNMHDI